MYSAQRTMMDTGGVPCAAITFIDGWPFCEWQGQQFGDAG
jgi:hypothetical protein